GEIAYTYIERETSGREGYKTLKRHFVVHDGRDYILVLQEFSELRLARNPSLAEWTTFSTEAYRLWFAIQAERIGAMPASEFTNWLIVKIDVGLVDSVRPDLSSTWDHMELCNAIDSRLRFEETKQKRAAALIAGGVGDLGGQGGDNVAFAASGGRARGGGSSGAGGAGSWRRSETNGASGAGGGVVKPNRPDNPRGASNAPVLGSTTSRAVDVRTLKNYQNWPPGVVEFDKKLQDGTVVRMVKFKVGSTMCYKCFGVGHKGRDCGYNADEGKARELREYKIIVPSDIVSGLIASLDEEAAYSIDDEMAGVSDGIRDLLSGAVHATENDRLVFDPNEPSHAAFLDGIWREEDEFFDAPDVSLAGYVVEVDFGSIIAFPAKTGVDALGGFGFILDSAATFSLAKSKELLFDYFDFAVPLVINGAFGSKGNAIGWGKMKYEKANGEVVVVDKVLYVPGLGVNLLSQLQLMRSGHRFTNDNTSVLWIDPTGNPVVRCPFGRTLIRVPASRPSPEPSAVLALTSAHTGASKLDWHRRMAHPEPPRADKTVRLVDGAANAKGLGRSFRCIACEMGKAHRHHNYNPRPREEKIGATIWSDGWGPARVQGRYGERYLLGVLDDATSKLWVVGLK
ncbi:hypothetical protein P7C70_g9277, partial [Phenoliferia sp. Uapishka_3]